MTKLDELFKTKPWNEYIVQEFIVGREFTALVFEDYDNSEVPIVVEPVEVVFLKEDWDFLFE